jgi:hypothetical protein
MARLTWQNVSAPSGASEAAAVLQSGDIIRRAMNGLGDVAALARQQGVDNASNAELLRLAQVGDAASVDRYLSGMAGRINPAMMNDTLQKALLGLRGDAQGYDTTRLNQTSTALANTGTAITNANRANEVEYAQAGREQAGGYNTMMSEAYRLARTGDTAGAERLVREANEKFPNMAGRVDPFSVSGNVVDSRKAGEGDRPDDRWLRDNSPAVINAGMGGINEADARARAYDRAKALGATEAAAQAAANQAVEAWKGAPNGTIASGTTAPADQSTAAADTVDRVLGAPATDGAALPVAPATVPAGNVPAGSVATSNDRVTGNPTASDIDWAVKNNPVSLIETIDTIKQRTDDAVATVVDGPLQRAYTLMSTQGTEGANIDAQVAALFDPEAQEGGVYQFNQAVRQIETQAGVSPQAAKAALLATVSGNPGYIASLLSNSPGVSINEAVKVARDLGDTGKRNMLSLRATRLKTYQSQATALRDQAAEAADQLRQYRDPDHRWRDPSQKERAIADAEKRLSTATKNLTALAARTESDFTPLRDDDDTGENNQSDPTTDSSNPDTAVKRTASYVEQILIDNGIAPAEVAQRSGEINKTVRQVTKEFNDDLLNVKRVDEILENLDKKLEKNSSAQTLNLLNPVEKYETAAKGMGHNELKVIFRRVGELMNTPGIAERSRTALEADFPQLMIDYRLYKASMNDRSAPDEAVTRILEGLLGQR